MRASTPTQPSSPNRRSKTKNTTWIARILKMSWQLPSNPCRVLLLISVETHLIPCTSSPFYDH
jgi:hypothetical protein